MRRVLKKFLDARRFLWYSSKVIQEEAAASHLPIYVGRVLYAGFAKGRGGVCRPFILLVHREVFSH